MSFLNTLIPTRTRTNLTQEGENGTGVPTVRPVYEIKENADSFDLTAGLPGVAKDGLEITAENGQLRILGRRAWKQPESWTLLFRESLDSAFELVLEHENSFDAEKIQAELRDGVLRMTLPKSEALKPRKIAVS
jgi:HSP20 family molecular chaperone IbpA